MYCYRISDLSKKFGFKKNKTNTERNETNEPFFEKKKNAFVKKHEKLPYERVSIPIWSGHFRFVRSVQTDKRWLIWKKKPNSRTWDGKS